MSTKTNNTTGQVIREIQARLDAKQASGGVALKVNKGGYSEDDGYLRVIVSPTAKGVRAYDYVETLSAVEKELHKAGYKHVLLLPAIVE